MRQQRHLLFHLTATLLLAVVTSAMWAAWLGWDQEYDVHPDGSQTGPYEAWQVIGLVLTLLAPVCWVASRPRFPVAVLGVPVGLTVAAFYDWSDDGSGLYVIGAGMVMMGSLAVTIAVSAVIALWKRHRQDRQSD